ncbi:hypothetical protein ACDP63_10860 [Paracoccus sp. P2]|uniref:Uncharacterized protein n=1 Tax=Paracoccus pantotrophus TaxID=82367 RepID=A0A1I5GCW2_PARPN|nr:hypothetical protein [Paracoccus pantotrophus]MDF3855704.1 hypothetical protein [Paracoccus pantotrophus]QFG35385.1 hypothetical protein ESD82_04150 [Paracoccus pantotrophus]QLH13627.1 hypothetical protein HYQ43_04955 [Paracoccus pantotrophus]RDD99569.1 hypothetical protein DTW92_03735 [Paracoccus pantotrophus]RKS44407.1 hypothetical protein BDE18_3254 [Paracoccus pantotrophus]
MSEPLTPAEAQAEARTATFLFTFALLVVVLAVVGLLLWGLPALGMLALAATVLMFAMLAAYAAGF